MDEMVKSGEKRKDKERRRQRRGRTGKEKGREVEE